MHDFEYYSLNMYTKVSCYSAIYKHYINSLIMIITQKHNHFITHEYVIPMLKASKKLLNVSWKNFITWKPTLG